MSTSSQMGTSGIFAKLVAKFLVKWIKKTTNKGQGSLPPALSAAPSDVSGHPERNQGVSTEACTCTTATYNPNFDAQMAAMWAPQEREARADALRAADEHTLRDGGMDERQVAQAGAGRVPNGYQMERVPATESTGQHYQLSPLSQQWQCNCNAVNDQIFSQRFGDVTVISLPVGGQQVTIILGGGAVLAG